MARERIRKKKESQARQIWRRFRKNRIAMAALVVLTIIVLLACLADLIWNYEKDACQINVPARLQKPSAEHWLGTDEMGRDMLCRIVYGARASLIVGLAATTFALLVGGVLGAVCGYYGGKLDNIIMRCTDVLLAIPGLLLAIAIMSAFKPNIFYISLALGISYISKFTRIVRSAVLTVREQEYIEAAKAIGAKDHTIILKHLLMNCMAPIFVQYALAIGSRILSVSTLSYIGMGIQAPTPDWGNMLSGARAYIRGNAYLVLGPGIALLLTISAFNLIGDGLRDAMDPRLKK
ncbi:ABC transporter permease [Aristaeella hokkaidonensis]|uniref:ABC transporter permease n=2 Tax=Aristaeella hokkaidonensis TaxID=3046382 RepID=A0AC61MVT9_9FIRM|nr:ABC transporter permease [Aristaeella hokkaidonensis]QUC66680.1 ABC transporter permease [Aristaeella hokkaidonensis]